MGDCSRGGSSLGGISQACGSARLKLALQCLIIRRAPARDNPWVLSRPPCYTVSPACCHPHKQPVLIQTSLLFQ